VVESVEGVDGGGVLLLSASEHAPQSECRVCCKEGGAEDHIFGLESNRGRFLGNAGPPDEEGFLGGPVTEKDKAGPLILGRKGVVEEHGGGNGLCPVLDQTGRSECGLSYAEGDAEWNQFLSLRSTLGPFLENGGPLYEDGCLEDPVLSLNEDKETFVEETVAGFQGIVGEERPQISHNSPAEGFSGVVKEDGGGNGLHLVLDQTVRSECELTRVDCGAEGNRFFSLRSAQELCLEKGVPLDEDGCLGDPAALLNEENETFFIGSVLETVAGLQGIVGEERPNISHNSLAEDFYCVVEEDGGGNRLISGLEQTEKSLHGLSFREGDAEKNQFFSFGITQGLGLENKELPYENGCLGDPTASHNKETETCFVGPVEENVPGFKLIVEEERLQISHNSPAEGCYGVVEESSLPQSSHKFDVVELGSSKGLSTPDFKEMRPVGGTPACCSSLIDSSQPTDGGRMDEVKAKCVSISDHTNFVHSSDSVRVTRARKARWQAFDSISGISSSKARGKRSRLCKPARSSIWGALGNLMHVFEWNDGKCDPQLAQAQKQGLRKARGGGLGRARRQKVRNGVSSRGSKGKRRATTNHIRSKVNMEGEGGQRSVEAKILEVVDSSASVQTVVNDGSPESDCRTDMEILKTANGFEYKLGADGCGIGQFSFLDRNSEKPVMSMDNSPRDGQQGDKDLESTVTQDTVTENTSSDCPGVSRCREASSDSKVMGQSVIVPEFRVQSVSQDTVLDPSKVVIASVDVPPTTIQRTSTSKGKKTREVKENHHLVAGCFSAEEKHLRTGNLNKARKSTKRRLARKVGVGLDTTSSKVGGQETGLETIFLDQAFGSSMKLPLSEMAEIDPCRETLEQDTGLETRSSSQRDVGTTESKSWMLEGVPTVKGHKLSKKSTVGGRKCRSEAPDLARSRRGNAHGQRKEGIGKSHSKTKVEGTELPDHVVYKEECISFVSGWETGGGSSFLTGSAKDSSSSGSAELSTIDIVGNDMFRDLERTAGNRVSSEGVLSSIGYEPPLEKSNHGLEVQCPKPRLAWVRCDDCHKWRCISAVLADEIDETNCKWTCKDNTDKAFGDCLIPQEKSNAQINEELEISDASCEEDSSAARPNPKGLGHRQLTAPQQASWRLIKSNLFLHRSRKTQTIDEIMVCHCKPPLDGRLGCGDECLNRMLNIECVQGTCPCGDLCSNQQFQKRKYANFKWFRCGRKGHGLQLLERVSQGQFLIEYVGEVLDLHAYEDRQKDYASRGQKHFYFMTLNGSEVIDACAKGNLGRFINHSCDPNCRTEKWMVNGEVCIGLFAIRDIKKGEEVTFDYNYVRVFGAAAKKCVCGSSECRGYIGGDPSKTEVIVQGDSDEDYPEPVMINEGGEEISLEISVRHEEISLETTYNSKTSPTVQQLEVSLETQDSMCKSSPVVQQLEISLQAKDSISKSSPTFKPSGVSLQIEESVGKSSPSVEQLDISLQTEDTMNKSFGTVQPLETSLEIVNIMNEPLSGSAADSSKAICKTDMDKPNVSKPCQRVKSSLPSGSIKKGRFRANQVMASKPKKMVEGTSSGRFEGVVEKLNELLDADGGISKRKDAAKGYLKLLFVTAAAGDNNANCEAFQSTRDLSLVLDALLKTKSRMVLVDIINKNGLQMLHNIMKQNRRNFNKIPVIRKLLKVLEFLAMKEVLTLDHINTAPPCTGMESFKESIMTLTWHNDTQVHQMARRFRDKYIPRTIGKVNLSDRDDGHCNRLKRWHDHGARHTDAIFCTTQEIPILTSRDQGLRHTDAILCTTQASPMPTSFDAPSNDSNLTDGPKRMRKRKSRWDQPSEANQNLPPSHHIEAKMMDANSNPRMEPTPQGPEFCEVQNHITEVKNEVRSSNGCDQNILSLQNEAPREDMDEDAPPGFDEDAPPGFPAPLSNPQVSNGQAACEVVLGHTQPRFLSHIPVSFGIPLDLVKQLGIPQSEGLDSWVVAPGVPFHPFPPLPQYPRGEADIPPESQLANHNRTNGGLGEGTQEASCHHVGHHVETTIPRANNTETAEQVRWGSGGLERKFFRQQKSNNRGVYRKEIEKQAPWIRHRDRWGFKGNGGDLRNRLTSGVAGNMMGNSTFYQQPQHHQYQN
ncbi:histone-lysine N-methyltransferase, partial [Tasmannia lanceolata]|uniref:histone-lysine N-methyltransferase n=1 Tax=Tasmannia lanceolata TaxID=3420 RepID=UPI00406439C2